MTAQTLRQQLRLKRQTIPLQQRALYSQQATSHALKALSKFKAKRIATFLSMAEEIDTRYLNEALVARHYEIYLPYVNDKRQPLEWIFYTQRVPLSHDRAGIRAPAYDPKLTLPAPELDAVITPLVGFDKIGNRLGMGGGYYDRSFSFKQHGEKPYLLGFAYHFQQVDTLLAAVWDVPLDGVITDQHFVLFDIN